MMFLLDSRNLEYTETFNKSQIYLQFSSYSFSIRFFINIDQQINHNSRDYLYVTCEITFRSFAQLNIYLILDIRPTIKNEKREFVFIPIACIMTYLLSSMNLDYSQDFLCFFCFIQVLPRELIRYTITIKGYFSYCFIGVFETHVSNAEKFNFALPKFCTVIVYCSSCDCDHRRGEDLFLHFPHN